MNESVYIILGMIISWISEGVALLFIALREKLLQKQDQRKKEVNK